MHIVQVLTVARLFQFFSLIIFFRIIMIVKQLMFLGISMLLALLSTNFISRYAYAGYKMSFKSGQN